MAAVRTQVVLVTEDADLRRAAERTRPGSADLHLVAPANWPSAGIGLVGERWLDLETVAAVPPCSGRRVYFYTDPAATRVERPPGIYIRKPCNETTCAVLWAGADLAERPAGAPFLGSGSELPPASLVDLPGWVTAFHDLDLKRLCRRCVVELPGRLGFSAASLYLHDSDRGLLTLAETTHVRPIDLAVRIAPGDRLMTQVAGDGRPLWTRSATQERALRGLPVPATELYPDDACLVAPLGCDGQLTAILNCSQPVATDPPLETSEVHTALDFVGRCLQHARMHDQVRIEARVDGLTGLFNQRWMYEALAREIRRAHRFDATLSVLLIDLDDLKHVNDQAGHAAGDALLRHVAGRITSVLRQFDCAARVGGDEFIVMLPATDLRGARHVGKRLLDAIRAQPAYFRDTPLPTTASIGAAEWEPSWSAAMLLEAADYAMYRAKSRGRDRLVCRARGLPLPEAPPTTTIAGSESRFAAEISDLILAPRPTPDSSVPPIAR